MFIVDLLAGIVELYDGTVELTDGVSSVSDKNTNVESVQFVIQTEAVEVEEAVTVESDATETLSFWKKLLKLFGLN